MPTPSKSTPYQHYADLQRRASGIAANTGSSNPGDQHGATRCTRDRDLFIDVKPLYLRAENTLFCIPRHYFQTSEIFEGMFTLPGVPNAPQEGSSEECPLFLESIKADELREFLRVLSCRLATNDNTTVRGITNSWLSVLKLASLWQFPILREKALKYLKSEDCMSRLRIARQYDVEEWFFPALRDLVLRNEPLTAAEMGQLGLDFAAKVIGLREKARGPPPVVSSVTSDDAIQRKFKGYTSASA